MNVELYTDPSIIAPVDFGHSNDRIALLDDFLARHLITRGGRLKRDKPILTKDFGVPLMTKLLEHFPYPIHKRDYIAAVDQKNKFNYINSYIQMDEAALDERVSMKASLLQTAREKLIEANAGINIYSFVSSDSFGLVADQTIEKAHKSAFYFPVESIPLTFHDSRLFELYCLLNLVQQKKSRFELYSPFMPQQLSILRIARYKGIDNLIKKEEFFDILKMKSKNAFRMWQNVIDLIGELEQTLGEFNSNFYFENKENEGYYLRHKKEI